MRISCNGAAFKKSVIREKSDEILVEKTSEFTQEIAQAKYDSRRVEK
jgi:hypothetical protein